MKQFKDKNILVTGGCGVIGRELIYKLVLFGANVRCVDFVDLPEELEKLPIEFYKVDLSDSKSQFLFRYNPDYVFHLAADFERSTESFDFWDSNFNNNVLASRNLLNKVMNCTNLKKIVFASSYLIYDKDLYTNDLTFLKETDVIQPRNLCGVAKLQTETDLNFINEFKDIDIASARIFRVYGRGSRDIISRWVEDAYNNKTIKVFSKDNSFDYIYAEDVADGLIQICKRNLKHKVYNIGTGNSIPIHKIVDILKNKFTNLKIDFVDDVIFPEKSSAHMGRLYEETMWQSKYDIEKGIDKVISYIKGNK